MAVNNFAEITTVEDSAGISLGDDAWWSGGNRTDPDSDISTTNDLGIDDAQSGDGVPMAMTQDRGLKRSRRVLRKAAV